MSDHCTLCHRPLDLSRYAVCTICSDARLCLACAREHFCTGECPGRGCRAGLCIKLVIGGVMAPGFGVPKGGG